MPMETGVEFQNISSTEKFFWITEETFKKQLHQEKHKMASHSLSNITRNPKIPNRSKQFIP